MKTTNKLILLSGIVACAALCFSLYLLFSSEKSAFIYSQQVFNDFQMKKELEKQLKSLESRRKNEIDSLKIKLRITYEHLNGKGHKLSDQEIRDFQYKEESVRMKEQQYVQENERLAQEYTEQVWKQLNQYVEDYGKKNGYDYVFGARGDGSLMYGSGAKDITEKVTNYVNNRYAGAGK